MSFFRAVNVATLAEQGLGIGAYSGAAVFGSESQTGQSILSYIPELAILHGILSVINGFGVCLNKPGYVSRGTAILQMISGVFLGAEGWLKRGDANPINSQLGLVGGFPLLYLGFAVNAGFEFFNALHTCLYEEGSETNKEANMINALAKGEIWLGWTALVINSFLSSSSFISVLSFGLGFAILAPAIIPVVGYCYCSFFKKNPDATTTVGSHVVNDSSSPSTSSDLSTLPPGVRKDGRPVGSSSRNMSSHHHHF